MNEQKVGAGSAATEDGKVPDAKEEKPNAVLKLEKSNFDEKIKEGVVFVKVISNIFFLLCNISLSLEVLYCGYQDQGLNQYTAW